MAPADGVALGPWADVCGSECQAAGQNSLCFQTIQGSGQSPQGWTSLAEVLGG